MFAQIYIGCKCGETWHVAHAEAIDTDKDEIYCVLYCTICLEAIWEEKKIDGVPCMHALTKEEVEAEMDSIPDGDDDDEEEDEICGYYCLGCGHTQEDDDVCERCMCNALDPIYF